MVETTTEAAADLPVALRRLRGVLGDLASPGTSAAGEAGTPLERAASSAADRLDRDLLPRTAGGVAHLVVGIVGPNNAGKSALFNALVGAQVSPSRPTGGATRHLVGAAHPSLLERLEREPTLARFPLRRVAPPSPGAAGGEGGIGEAVVGGEDPAELLLVEAASLEDGVLLVDTPDFDSIQTDNRRASEALLRVADLALVVVTRHTYQNREVVEFLEGWLGHGRPWLLVYNESISPEVTGEHAEKLSADLAVPPVATFHAPFDRSIAEGRAPLMPRALGAGPGTLHPREGEPLAPWLLDLPQASVLKGRALSASLAQLADELDTVAEGLGAERDRAEGLLTRARAHAGRLGADVAAAAMPAGPFLEAFRAVLDRRPGRLQRGLRGALRRTRAGVEKVLARLPFPRRAGTPVREGTRLLEVEGQALESAWMPFFEALAADLDPTRAPLAGAAGTGDGTPPGELTAALAADLAPARAREAGTRARQDLGEDPQVMVAFQDACEALIEEEFDARGNEWFLQLAVDAVHLVPALAAGVLILKTGGLGTDVAVGSAGALTTLLAERLSRLLGTRVAWRARERWTQLRGARLAEVVLGAALQQSAPLLEQRSRAQAQLADRLEEATREVAWRARESSET